MRQNSQRHDTQDRLLTTAEAAAFLGMSVRTLEGWRTKILGPVYLHVGGRVRYRVADLEAWLDTRIVTEVA